MPSACEMPAGVGGFISFHIQRSENISQFAEQIILHRRKPVFHFHIYTLETVMVAWHLGVVDRKIIEEQFHFLTDPDKGTTLAEFRHSAGGYPMIEAFIDTIKDTKPKTKPKNLL